MGRTTRAISKLAQKLRSTIKEGDRTFQTFFKIMCEANGILEPVAEHRFHQKRKWLFDFAWLGSMIAVEVEGGVWTRGRHTRGQGYIDDMEKYNEAAILGWRVLRFTPQQVNTGEAMQTILRALEAA